jgi:hypothetical protein
MTDLINIENDEGFTDDPVHEVPGIRESVARDMYIETMKRSSRVFVVMDRPVLPPDFAPSDICRPTAQEVSGNPADISLMVISLIERYPDVKGLVLRQYGEEAMDAHVAREAARMERERKERNVNVTGVHHEEIC